MQSPFHPWKLVRPTRKKIGDIEHTHCHRINRERHPHICIRNGLVSMVFFGIRANWISFTQTQWFASFSFFFYIIHQRQQLRQHGSRKTLESYMFKFHRSMDLWSLNCVIANIDKGLNERERAGSLTYTHNENWQLMVAPAWIRKFWTNLLDFSFIHYWLLYQSIEIEIISDEMNEIITNQPTKPSKWIRFDWRI